MKRLLIVLALMSLLGVSAASCSVTTGANRGNNYFNSQPDGTHTASLPPKVPDGAEYDSFFPTPTVPEDRMIVRTGNTSIVVDNINEAINAITRLAENYSGYVVSSNIWKDGNLVYGSISIRVPSTSYTAAGDAIADIAVEVTSQSSTSHDVTEEYIDLSARLSTLESTERQLLAIMAQATEISDVLAVQSQLTVIRSQIEQIKGRMKYLEGTSSTSLINVNLYQAKLNVNFNASMVNTMTGKGIQFYPSVSGGFTPYSYQWDFGDGKTSTDFAPVHSYDKPGTFSVTLKVTDNRGNTVSETRVDYIKITQGGWSAAGVVQGALEAALWLGRALASIAIVLGVFSPLIIVIVLVVWLMRRRGKSKTG